MTDLAQIEKDVVTFIAAGIYPSAYLPGDYAQTNVQWSGSYGHAKTYRGWPESANLNGDLAAGYAHVSVFSEPGMSRLTTRWSPVWTQAVPAATPTITATVSGATVTIGGTVAAGQVIGVEHGPPANQVNTVYRVLASDTLASIAASLAAGIPGASAAGAVLTVPSTIHLHATIEADQSAYFIARQQQQGIRVSVWCPTPSARDALASAVDIALTTIGLAPDGTGFQGRWQTIDGSQAFLRYAGTFINDMPSKDRLWRRDLRVTVEFSQCITGTMPRVVFPGMTTNGGTLIPSA